MGNMDLNKRRVQISQNNKRIVCTSPKDVWCLNTCPQSENSYYDPKRCIKKSQEDYSHTKSVQIYLRRCIDVLRGVLKYQ